MIKTEIKEIIDREIDASTKSFCRVIKCDANTTRLTTLISEHDLDFVKHAAKLKNDIQAYDVEKLGGLIAMTINKAVISRLSFSDEPLTIKNIGMRSKSNDKYLIVSLTLFDTANIINNLEFDPTALPEIAPNPVYKRFEIVGDCYIAEKNWTLVGKDDLIVIIKPVVVEDQDHDFVVFVEYAIVDMSNNQ